MEERSSEVIFRAGQLDLDLGVVFLSRWLTAISEAFHVIQAKPFLTVTCKQLSVGEAEGQRKHYVKTHYIVLECVYFNILNTVIN